MNRTIQCVKCFNTFKEEQFTLVRCPLCYGDIIVCEADLQDWLRKNMGMDKEIDNEKSDRPNS